MPRPLLAVALDEEQIRELASLGLTDEKIALLARCSARTLQRRFGGALKEGRVTTERNLRRALIEQALSGNTAALIFACKTLAGLREKERDDPAAVRIEIVESPPAPPVIDAAPADDDVDVDAAGEEGAA